MSLHYRKQNIHKKPNNVPIGGELPREAEEVLHIMDHPYTKNNQLPECSFQGREDFKVLHNELRWRRSEDLTQSIAPSTLIPILTTFQIPQLLFYTYIVLNSPFKLCGDG